MREEEYNELDQLFRSALQDAEVKAPRSAWKAVSARLDEKAAAAAASTFGWMKWAGASLALAAALAAGLFLGGTFKSEPTIKENTVAILTNDNSNQEQKLTAQAQVTDSEPVAEEQDKKAPVKKEAQQKAPAAPQQAKPAQAPAKEPAKAPVAEPGKETEAEPRTEPAAQPQAKPSKKAQNPETISEREAWAALELEDSRHSFKPHAALAFAGTLNGNDSDLLVRTSRPGLMSPGETTKKIGIEEGSTSSYGIPFTLGLGVRIHFAPRLSIGTGIDYSLLSRSFNGTYYGPEAAEPVKGDITHTMQYIGIPINLYYDILSGGRAKFYVWGGGEAEYCVSNKYLVNANPQNISYSTSVKGLQYSVGAGLGVEFKFGNTVGLYLDPGVNYYFHCDQPKNVRTERPLMFNFEAGLRFNLGGK